MGEEHDITLTIHGLTAYNGEVDGEVFAEKFAAFMRGLAASDIAANGKRSHKFLVSDLVKNTATAKLKERVIRSANESGVSYFKRSVTEIRNNSTSARQLSQHFVQQVVSLNTGAEDRFEFGEIKFEDGEVIRIDRFLAARAAQVLADIRQGDSAKLSFQGVAHGSFDGVLKAVDLQHKAKSAVLWLSAGGLPINCNITEIDVAKLGSALDRRVVVYGLAHYETSKGLPLMINVKEIEVIEAGEGLGRWRGRFDIPDDMQDDNWSDF